MMRTVPRFLIALFAATLLFLGGLQSGAALAAPTTPTSDFTDNFDGTVTHKITGLTWKRCAEGQSWSGSTCTGAGQGYTWAQATALTSTFAGKSDWRLPTVRELSTIVELDAYVPAINGTIFPNTPASHFWSASAVAGHSDHAWLVYFANGHDGFGIKTGNLYVRLVRGGQSLGLLASIRPTTDYVDNGDGAATHTPTALTWKRCAEGQNWTGATCSGTAATYTWAQATALAQSYAGYSDWRLPTLTELRSLVDFTLTNPSINRTIFPDTSTTSYFWSASAYAGYSAYAWYVYFNDGYGDYDGKANAFQVRLVRGGQSIGTSSPAVSLNEMSLSCPTTLNAGASGSCTATASYSNGTTKAVSPTWSSSNPAALSVNSSGSLTAGTPSIDTTVTISASYTENGITKTASQSITAKVPVASLASLTATCPATLNAGTSGTCNATASYSDGSSRVVNATWSSKNYGELGAPVGANVNTNATAVDAAGNVYIAGYFTGATYTLGSATLFRIGTQDAFVAKLNAAGTVVWAKSYGGSGAYAQGKGIAVDGSGNVYLGGFFYGAALTTPALTLIGDRDAFALKLDASGNTVWAQNYGGSGAMMYGTGIAVDGTGNVYLGRYFAWGDLTMPALTIIGDQDAFALKLDASGNTVWAQNYGGGGATALGTGIAVDGTGNVYLGGYFNAASLTTPALTKIGTRDAFALKLDASGNTTWAQNYGGSGANAYGTGIAVDGSGNVYLGGYFTTANLTAPALAKIGTSDAFALKLNASGNTTWAQNYGGSGATAQGKGIAVDGGGNVYLGGVFDADLTAPSLTLIGDKDAFALKLNASGNTTWAQNYGGSGAMAGG